LAEEPQAPGSPDPRDPRERRRRFRVDAAAHRDIADILKRSLREFGVAASVRYRDLIRQALLDIEADYKRPGSIERPDLMVEGARTYHLSSSRMRVPGKQVNEPRHFLLYRRRPDGVVEVARILHDSRDLARHLPAGYHRFDV
jgi:toxin ParE1/3/4